jgi:hypothetical protein
MSLYAYLWTCQDQCCSQPLILELTDDNTVLRTIWRGVAIYTPDHFDSELLKKQHNGFTTALATYGLKEIHHEPLPIDSGSERLAHDPG